MLVITKKRFLEMRDSSENATYDVTHHSVYPKENIKNYKPVSPSYCVQENWPDKVTKIVICLCDKTEIVVTKGTKVLMRNGEYKEASQLKPGDLLLTSGVYSEGHVGEVLYVYSETVDLEENEVLVDSVSTHNFAYNSLFIKSEAYAA